MTGTSQPYTEEKLEQLLAEKKLTITGIARKAEVAVPTFRNYLTGGRVRPFEATKIEKVCREILGINFVGEVYRPGRKKQAS